MINDDLPFGSGCGNIGEFSKPIPDGAEDCTDLGASLTITVELVMRYGKVITHGMHSIRILGSEEI